MKKLWSIKIGSDVINLVTTSDLRKLLNSLITEGSGKYEINELIKVSNEINEVLNRSIGDFFKERPALKQNVIADEAGISVKTLRKIIYGGAINIDKDRLIDVLTKYGY